MYTGKALTAESERANLLLKTSVQSGLLGFIVVLTFFLNLGKAEPSIMEARNFITVREITQNDSWLIPTMNGYARLAKPPLPTWITALAGLGAGNIENLAALRLPSSVMAGLAVFFLLFLARQLTADRLVPFLAALVLASSFMFINTGRQATWDIYCHSFALGAIWLLVSALRKPGSGYFMFSASGALLGCSFLSKGPVAFYALLLPFLLAYGFAYPLRVVREKRSGIVLMLSVCLLVGFPWPLYVYLMEPAGLAHNVLQESTAWMNRHVKPPWYYWGFFVQSGIWTPFVIAALAVPYASRRIGQYGNYRFLLSWVLITIVLLSVIPEKKERYLLPVLMPMALLTAHYLRYLIYAFSENLFNRWEKVMLLASGFLFSMAAFAAPVYMFFAAHKLQAVSGGRQVVVTLLFLLLGTAIIVLTRRYKVICLFVAASLLNALVFVFVMPLYQEGKGLSARQGGVPELEEVRKRAELRSMKFYAVSGMRPESIWEVGKEVDTLRIVRGHLQLPEGLPAVVFSLSPLRQAELAEEGASLHFVSQYQHTDGAAAEKYYMYILSRGTPKSKPPETESPETAAPD
ncbi:ArnT family glycosyltransferase [Pontibacter russatus]|uniref:ArnT family glycosyltransferase n=1 Tax=Pontibacter russatus TaxID=2694929 RepID=UPI00137A1DD0|nr:glycosyltransferase family 39 protein [Pontibacter russatus]